MPRTITKEVFTFDELSPAAKEKARDWYREGIDTNDFQNVIEDAQRAGEMLGIDFATHEVTLYGGGKRRDANIWWTLSYSQGDGACFEGTYRYAKGAADKLAKEYGEDYEPAQIARALQVLQKAHGYRLHAAVVKRDHHYAHEHTVSIEVTFNSDEYRPAPDPVAKEVTELLRRFMRWIHKSLREENEYLTADEQVDESILINGYEFEADGRRTRDA